jgi:hypothetical protein
MSRNYFQDFALGHAWGQNQFVDRPRALKENAENRDYLNTTRQNELQDRQNMRGAVDQHATDEKQRHDMQAAQTRESTRAAMKKMKHALFETDDPTQGKQEVMEILNDPAFQGLRDKFTGGQPILGGGLGEDGQVGVVFDRGDGQTTGFAIPYEDFADTILEYGMGLDPEYARQLGTEGVAPPPGLAGAERPAPGAPQAQAPQGGAYSQRVAQIESAGGTNRRNPNSNARGIYQWMPETADEFGLDWNALDRGENLDAEEEAAFEKFTERNRNQLRQALGRDPEEWELYLAHQQGGGGASKLLRDPSALAEDVVGKDAVELNGGRAGMTAGEFAQHWQAKYEGAAGPEERPGLGQRAMDAVISPAGADQAGMGLENANSGSFGEPEPEGEMAPSSLLMGGGKPSSHDIQRDLARDRRANERVPGGASHSTEGGPVPQYAEQGVHGFVDRLDLGGDRGLYGGAPSVPGAAPRAESEAPSAEAPPATPRAERQGLMAGLGLSQADLLAIKVDTAGQHAGGGRSGRPSDKSIDAAAEFLFQGKIGLEDFQNYARTGSFGKPEARQAQMNMGKEGGYVFDPNTNTSRWVGPDGGPSKPTVKWSDIEARDKTLARVWGYEDSSDFGFLREKGMWDVTLAARGERMEDWFSSPGGESAMRQTNVAQRAIERGGRRWWHKLPFTGVEDKHFSRTLAIQLVQSGAAANGSDREVYEASEKLQEKYYHPLQAAWEATGRGGELSAHQASVFTQGMIEMEHALQRGPGAVEEVLWMLQQPEVDWNPDRMQQQLIQMREARGSR